MASGGGLSGVAIRRPIFTIMVMLGLLVLGIFGYRQLAIDQFPDIEFPVVAVMTTYTGASPEVVEREVTRPLEEAFNTVQGVQHVTSYSVEGMSEIIIEFELSRKVENAAQDIRGKIEAVRMTLPQDIDVPIVQTFDPMSMPIISLAISSPTVPVTDLTVIADEQVRRTLEAISGVGQARLTGGLARQIRVNVLPDRLRAAGVTVSQVMAALQRQNMDVPAGQIQTGATQQLVRVAGRISDPRQFDDVIVASHDNGPIRLKDVARVEVGAEEERSAALVDGSPAVALDVLKVSGANTVEVADRVKEAVAQLDRTLPKDVNIRIVRDNSVMIQRSVDDVIHELLLGALLTVLVVMLFLNDFKATFITAMALPVSVISAFILMSALGFTLNIITLLALALSIGILIDDAIVVIENIVRHREMGKDHFSASRDGTREIVLAVMATTFTIVAVFVPVAFMKGIVGRFFYQFGLTVAWAVLVSLFVSFTLTPMLSAYLGVDPHSTKESGKTNPLQRLIGLFDRWFRRRTDEYGHVLNWALRHRKSTLGIATLAFIGAIALFPLIGGAFMPDSDQSQLQVSFQTPQGSSLDYVRQKAQQMTALLRQIPGVDYTYTTLGEGAQGGFGGLTSGQVYVKLVDRKDRKMSQQQLEVLARQRLKSVFGVQPAFVSGMGGGGQQALQVQVSGPDMDRLSSLSREVEAEVDSIPGIVDVQRSVQDPTPELRIEVDRDLANRVGLDIGQLATTVRPLFAGQTATRWEDPTGEERDVVVQVPQDRRTSVADVASLPVATTKKDRNGNTIIVSLGNVARIVKSTAPAKIDRYDLKRVITVSGGTAPDLSVSEASAEIRAKLKAMSFPPGYGAKLAGETEQLEETFGYVVQTILLSIILIFLILASQFESVLQPFAIMLSLPLSLVGVLLALLITGDTLNMMSMIGVILLMGLVTKNAILLVDNTNERRAQGKARHQALLEAGAVRMRPIMMTTMAMIFGMLPIALALGEGSGFRAPMARAVIGGLITSTMLTLLVVPVAYTYFDDIGAWIKARFVSEERERQIHEEQKESGLEPGAAWGD
ncbi:MAG: efflux RND transporter permease subunit [Gemmatimonadota bacterium]|jgi:HAE1 family hydrophobic/amphiphilic exporter-1